jgi:hypothetical protein
MPTAKYSSSGSPDMFWNGSIAIDGLSGNGAAAGRPAPFPLAPDTPGSPGDVLYLPIAEVVRSSKARGGWLPMWSRAAAKTQIVPGSP